MNFLDVSNNTTFQKKVLPREETAKLSWGIKRYLSLDPRLLKHVADLDQYYSTLGPGRFYDLMVMALPVGRYFIKGLGKQAVDKLTMNEDIRRRVCRHFHISTQEIPMFLEIWNNRGKSIQDLFAMFGYNKDGKTRSKKKAKRRTKKK